MDKLLAAAARYRVALSVALVLLLVALGFTAMEELTRHLSYAEVRGVLHAMTVPQIVAAMTFTALSYLALTLYDALALRVIGRPLPWRTAALASFTSYTLSHNLGLSLVTGGSARYRIYTAAGLDGPDIARVIGVASATFWSGIITVAGAALLARSDAISLAGVTLSPALSHVMGAAILATAAALVLLCAHSNGPLRWHRFSLPLPSGRQALAQIGVALIDVTAAAAALFVLMPGASLHLLPSFVLAYALGIVAAVVTHVPGGIGVFEAVVLAVLPGDRVTAFAALVAYRLIYYLLPLAVSVVMLAVREVARRRTLSLRLLREGRAAATGIAPLVLSAATFIGGAMLLLSGSLPSLKGRMGMLSHIAPLPFIEASHIAASLVGTGLLLLAPGLYRRLDGAFVATRALLIAGAIFSLVKGIDYEEATACLMLAALLHWTRAAFYRRTALTQMPLSGAWLGAVAVVVASATWAGFFAYRQIPYQDDLWWRFALRGDAPRFLRATLGVAVLLAGVAIWRWMGPAPSAPDIACDPGKVSDILARGRRTDALLALTGDKNFLLSERGTAMLMYRRRGASWIVMGDPVGEQSEWPDLLWRIRDLADAAQGRLLLYQITPPVLDLAIGMGLHVIKYGEEAVVDLRELTFETPRMRSVRKAERAAARRGLTFRIVPASGGPAIIDELRVVSDEWAAAKGHAEKGFSLGRFDADYLSHFDVALAMVDDRIVAFANLWLTANRAEASVDLMRHRDDAPSGTMDFLFVHVMQWAREQGYERFSLGIAPLSGIAGRRLAPAWARAAALVFQHGERFYGFRGLRTYKEKFAPDWEPRYIAGPRGLGLVQALRDLSRLIGQPSPVPVIAPAAKRREAEPPKGQNSAVHPRPVMLAV
ncbi:phosphatidylglycerol lysyltransferase [Sphingomonas palmae]|uniref:Phosphatidylglycerol lysyltransferase n=1 Tax=Sphingomonas palmae TaxID=1855283 RepID=A0A1H7GCT3_9SPHN|nr:bifunctional lysylphosphatidylglycerol flippase/synthetase MprF [Sphingomonas palmae]SEK35931.1 phosphatidylglycerol lysyltransferase [Sphingomonas palmae]